MSFSMNCQNLRKQRSQFFFYEAGSNVRYETTSPYVKDSSGNLIYTPKDLDMRRKAEILKYEKPNNNNVHKNKFSQLAKSSNKAKNRITCPADYKPKPTSSSDVPGKIINLYESPNVPLYNYIPILDQFRFQNIKYDQYDRLFDKFPISNIVNQNTATETFATIIILNPDSNQFKFDFSIPLTISFSCEYNTATYYTTSTNEIRVIDPATGLDINGAIPIGTAFKLTNANLSVVGAEMDIFYSDTLMQTIIATYKTGTTPAEVLPSDMYSSLLTDSITLSESNAGTTSSKQYVGNLHFTNITLKTISQYVYTFKIRIYLSYSEYTNIESLDSVLPYRTNINGDNISNAKEKNIQNATYGAILNIEDSQIYMNNNVNCTAELFDFTGEITTPSYIPLNIKSTSLQSK